MGLEGYLEDLGICDILQIVSLSKKSGTLTLSNKAGQGAVSFSAGQVVRAVSSQNSENLGTLLCRKQIATKQQILAALAVQKESKKYRPLGAILSEENDISQEQIEAIVKEQIEAIVLSFFEWTSGNFVFQLEDQQYFGSACLNPLDFMLEQGIAPQLFVEKGLGLAGTSALREAMVPAAAGKAVNQTAGEQDLDLLRGMLAELEYPSMNGGIILLILRYASEFLRRAIIFDVRGRQLVGLGQFGLDDLTGSADEIVRKMRLTAETESLFGQVLQQQAAVRGELGDFSDESFVCGILGSQPEEVFVGPLVSDGEVVAILYGDNYPAKGPIKSANAFEIFLAQAGLAMEEMLRDGV